MKTRKIQYYAFKYIKYNCEHDYKIHHGFENVRNNSIGYTYKNKWKGFSLELIKR